MKRLLYSSIFFFLLCSSASAQLKLTLVLSPTPPSTLSEWATRKEVLTLLVTGGGSGGASEAKIKAEIKTLDGTVIGTTDLARAQVFTFTTGNVVLGAAEVLPLENMIFTGKYRTALNKSGKLPADNYTLCVQLVRPADFAPLTEQVCRNFYLANTQLPILMKPYNEEVLDGKVAQTAITFRWTPVVPQLREPVTYRIQVFEILDYQTPLQALRSNQPLLDKEVKGMTQYIWQPQLSFIDIPKDDGDSSTVPSTRGQNNNTVKSNRGTEYKANSNNGTPGLKRFIWTIQSLDALGNPVNQSDGNGESRSEPILFFINADPSTPQQKQKTKEKKSSGLKDTLKTNV